MGVDSSRKIWLIGGTKDSAEIAKAIAAENFACIVTVTTETAKGLYVCHPVLTIVVGKIDRTRMRDFCQQERISVIVDASHPHAAEISQGAIAIATELQLPYLRYERPYLDRSSNSPNGLELDSFATLLAGDYLNRQRVLLTVGYKTLPLFQSWQDRATLFARILPSVQSLEVAFSAGFTPDRLIALRLPISLELEKALWQQWQISLVVTKASGVAGGEDTKRVAARELGIPLIAIARPKLVYPQQTSNLSEVVSFCRQYLNNSD